jgi:hypothetical protein
MDSTAFDAKTLRSRDICSVVPRSGLISTSAGAEFAAGVDVGGVTEAEDLIRASTSSLRIRPPIPVPVTLERSTPLSFASFLTIGVT